jgi:hypothetical protein
MAGPSVERRAAELHLLRATDPAQIIDYYRRIAAVSADGQLPPGVSFTKMIHAILVHEVRSGKLDLPRTQLSQQQAGSSTSSP